MIAVSGLDEKFVIERYCTIYTGTPVEDNKALDGSKKFYRGLEESRDRSVTSRCQEEAEGSVRIARAGS